MKLHYSRILIGTLVTLGLGALLVLAFLQVGSFMQITPASQAPTPTDPVLASLNRQIEQYEKDLQKNLAPDTRQNVQGKKKFAEREATQRVEVLGHQAENWIVKQTAIAELTLTPPVQEKEMSTLAPGLYTEISGPIPHEAVFSAAWVVHTKKDFIIYYVGRLMKDPDQGVIYIENQMDGSETMIYTPSKDGRLKITDVEKNQIKLESKKGRKYFFNMDKKKFVDELDNPLSDATATPVPAYPAP